MTAHGDGVSLLEFDSRVGCTTLNMLETIELHTSICLILWYVNFISILKKRKRKETQLLSASTILLAKIVEKMDTYWPKNILNITLSGKKD